jgi:uncharacterized membrane protein
MIRGFACIIAAASATLVLAATPAHAELTLCNRTSYRVEAAIGHKHFMNARHRGTPAELPMVLCYQDIS